MFCRTKKVVLTVFILTGHIYAGQCFSYDDKSPQVSALAPGYGELDFKAAKAGTYQLPSLGKAFNANVVDVDGNTLKLEKVFTGKYTLLSFIYTRCNDANGCPLTYVVYNRIRHQAKNDSEIEENLQLVSMSFDPVNDTPAVIKSISESLNGHDSKGHDSMEHDSMGHDMHHAAQASNMKGFIKEGSPATRQPVGWIYLTTDSKEMLKPLLQHYNQDVQQQINSEGNFEGNFSYFLRAFLIDPEHTIRNIYSVSFLHPDVILNDVKTLMMEKNETKKSVKLITDKVTAIVSGPGDNKENYQSKNYQTRSRSLEVVRGKETDLLKNTLNKPAGLPSLPVPVDNPLTEKKIKLGKKLFFDRRLSLNKTISCAMCHIPEQGFTSNELKTPVGFEGRSIRRNSPTLYNVAYQKKLHHDGRETSLENQIWLPLLASNEMAMPSMGMVIERIKGLTDYNGLFEKAFKGRPVSVTTLGKAIASYERTLISANSAFDRWLYGREKNALSSAEKRGFKLFSGKARCSLCHRIEKEDATFTDQKLHNTGIGWVASMGNRNKAQRVQVSPGRFISIKKSVIDTVSNPEMADLGLYEVTQKPADRWRYRTPGLRNIELTAPYMHDGSLATLNQVVDFYNQGGIGNENQSPLVKSLNLTKQEKKDLVLFLKSLTGDNVERLVSDALSTPVGNTQSMP